jgi:hypothetical protein
LRKSNKRIKINENENNDFRLSGILRFKVNVDGTGYLADKERLEGHLFEYANRNASINAHKAGMVKYPIPENVFQERYVATILRSSGKIPRR